MSDSATLDDENPLLDPPQSHRTRDTAEGYGRALKFSFGAHAAFIVLIVIKSLIFPGKATPYVPTLRVDMVDLPDVLKKDLQNVPNTANAKEIAEALKNAESEAKKIKPVKIPDEPPTEKTDPDELVLKPKKAVEAPDKPLKREKRMMSALDRIKALSKIESEDAKSEARAKKIIVKGNKLSKGTSLSGDAKEAAQASYYDELRSKLQENWALPVWIARQNLNGQVRIYVDSNGRVRSFRFAKSSGNAQFDSAIKKTLEESQPFPRPPDEIASSLLVEGIIIGFPL